LFFPELNQPWAFIHHPFKDDSDLDEEVIYLWSRFSSLDLFAAEVQEENKRRAELPTTFLQACALNEHNLVLTDSAGG
jgi:hypothetical protein